MAAAKKNSEATGSAPRSLLISFWKEGRNLGVLSSTDRQFVADVERWAKEAGMTTRPGVELEES